MHHVQLFYDETDVRSPFVLEDVQGADFEHINAQREADVPTFVLHNVRNFNMEHVNELPDVHADAVDEKRY
jgi:DNA-dependent RNA polymerase auxiliary subunit epsilon